MRQWTMIFQLILAGLLVFTAGCTKPEAVTTAVNLEEVKHPSLESVEQIVRQQILEQRKTLDKAREQGKSDRELADAFGGMGELYHAYRFYGAAAASYRNAAVLDPESFPWPYYLGVLHQDQGLWDPARLHFEQALERRNNDPATLIRLANILVNLERQAEAKSYFQSVTGDSRFTAAATFGLGQLALAESNFEEAVDSFEKVLEIQPEAVEVQPLLAQAYAELGQEAEAGEFRQAAEPLSKVQMPDRLLDRLESLAVSSESWMERGKLAQEQGHWESAATAFRNAAQADSTNSQAPLALARVLIQKNEPQEALRLLKEAALQHPEDGMILLELGQTYAAEGLHSDALEPFRQAATILASAQAYFALANSLAELKQWKEAEKHLGQVLEFDPEHSEARYLLAISQHRGGKTQEAVAELQELVEKQPTHTEARKGLATVLKESRQIPRALAVYRRGVELDIPAAEKLQLLLELAELTWKAGRQQEAIRHWRKAVEIAPESSEAFTNLANGLQLLGQRQEARQHFAKAVEIDPTNADAWLSEASLWILDKEFQKARDRLDQALEHISNHARLTHTLARLLATSSDSKVRDGQRAIRLARDAYALESTLDHAETIAMALAEAGKFEEAIQWQRGLVNQAAVKGDRQLLQRLVARLRLYENRRPLHTAS